MRAYTLPIPVVPALETALSVGTLVVLQVPTHLLLRHYGVWHHLFGTRRAAMSAGNARPDG